MTESRLSSSTEGKRRPALEFALARLARRAHSEKELSFKLERASYSRPEIAETLDWLKSRRYLDDAAFARTYAQVAVTRKSWGPERIAASLRERGLSETHVSSALAEAFPDGESPALQKAFKRFRRTRRPRGNASEERARAYRHLFARGFSPEAIRAALTRTK